MLAAGSAVAYLVGPVFLGALIPRYAAGLPALRPLLPGMVLLGLAWLAAAVTFGGAALVLGVRSWNSWRQMRRSG